MKYNTLKTSKCYVGIYKKNSLFHGKAQKATMLEWIKGWGKKMKANDSIKQISKRHVKVHEHITVFFWNSKKVTNKLIQTRFSALFQSFLGTLVFFRITAIFLFLTPTIFPQWRCFSCVHGPKFAEFLSVGFRQSIKDLLPWITLYKTV